VASHVVPASEFDSFALAVSQRSRFTSNAVAWWLPKLLQDKADVSVEYEETKGNGGSILLTIRPNKVGAGKLTTIQCFGLAADADQHYLGGHDGHGAGYADLNLAPKTDDRAAGMLQFWLRETTTHTAPKRKITIKGVQVRR
jgi:hypothetical protein